MTALHNLDTRTASASCEATTLPEIMGAFSYALDLTEGQPPGHSLRACRIAMAIVDELHLDAVDRRVIYYTTMLKDLGCSSNSARVAEIYLADDRTFKHDFKLIGNGIGPALRFVLTQMEGRESLGRRAGAFVNILRNGPALARSLIQTRCTRGAEIARLLRFPEEVAAGIYALDEHWDGGGKPDGRARDGIPLAARMALLAQIAEVFSANAGPDAARAEISRLSAKWLDPELSRAFLSASARPEFWTRLNDEDLARQLAVMLPDEAQIAVDEDFLDDIADAFGQVIDAKSPYTWGHSARVGRYSAMIAGEMGFDPAATRLLRRAAMLHDVGKLGVSSQILEKPGKLDPAEWSVMQGHAGQTARILGRISPFRDMALIAASHHERLDGKGYPLGLDAQALAREARIITVCDFFDALTADRPYRAALSAEQAFEIMQREAGSAIDPECLAHLRTLVEDEKCPCPGEPG